MKTAKLIVTDVYLPGTEEERKERLQKIIARLIDRQSKSYTNDGVTKC